MSLENFIDNFLLIHLSLAKCQLSKTQAVHLPNLNSLDLSDNQLHVVDVRHFRPLGNLRVLFLSRNPMRSQMFSYLPTKSTLPPIQIMDLSGAAFAKMDLNIFHHFLQLKVLNVSPCGLDTVTGSISSQSQIRSLDIRGNSLKSFSPAFVRKAVTLQKVWADSYKVCCPQVLPEGFILSHCQSPSDSVSSCHSLLKQAVYQVSALIQASLTLLGNVANFVIHIYVKKDFTRQSHGVFFVHLCVSQAVMGVHQAIIATADLRYRGDYVWHDVAWRESVACRLAGLLYLLSTQTSMVLTCFLMLDPLLLQFCPRSQVHFTATSAHAVSALTWLCNLTILSFLLITPRLGQTALCVSTLLADKREAGHSLVPGMTVVLYWVLLAWQAISQGALFHVIQSRPLAFITAASACRRVDTARCYSGIAMLHLLCWLPLCVIVVLTSVGVRIPAEMTSVLTLVMLPISPSLCSIVYYVSLLRLTQRYRQRQRMLQRVEWRNIAVATEKVLQ